MSSNKTSQLSIEYKHSTEYIEYLEKQLKFKSTELQYYKNNLQDFKRSINWQIINNPNKNIIPYLKKVILGDKNIFKTVNPYNNISILKPIEVIVVNRLFNPIKSSLPYTLSTTIFNEESTIIFFLNSIKNQLMQPNEVIIVDGGSSDDTINIVKKYLSKYKLSWKFIYGQNLSVSQGRNVSLREATNEYILIADAGSTFDQYFAANLIGGFSEYRDIDIVGGIYAPIVRTIYSQFFVPDFQNIDWSVYLPSTRAMAIKKSLVKKVGYFKDYLHAGDDTLFDIEYRRISKKWLFNKKALVNWDAPETLKRFKYVSSLYGQGDGESGIGDYFYSESNYNNLYTRDLITNNDLKRYLIEGYMIGKTKRIETEIYKKKIKGVLFFISSGPVEMLSKKKMNLIKRYIKKNIKILYIYKNKVSSYKEYYLDLDPTLIELFYEGQENIQDLFDKYMSIRNKIEIVLDSTSENNSKYIDIANKYGLQIKIIK